MSDKVYVTQEGLQELIKERDYLVHTERPEVIEDLKAARAQGDLSENADYDAARDRQSRIEARLRDLEVMLQNIEIIEENKAVKGKKVVQLGSVVTIEEVETGTQSTYSIVGTVEADPLNGKLSYQTPLGEALLEKKINTEVLINVKKPYKVKIIAIK